MERVEWNDVQGLVLSGYPELRYAAYVLWRFAPDRRAEAKRWISDLVGRVMNAGAHDVLPATDAVASDPGQSSPSEQTEPIRNARERERAGTWAINLALTASGLAGLGVRKEELAFFSTGFLEGMAPPVAEQTSARRSRLLGDVGENSPRYWQWGGGKPPIDGLLLLYAESSGSLAELLRAEESAMSGAAMAHKKLIGRLYEDGKEHFGFRDGISQPIIAGTRLADSMSQREKRISVVQPGEFVLGYPSERKARVTFQDVGAAGANKTRKAPSRNLARNGTYLVFRQLEQDVHAFNQFISATAKLLNTSAGTEDEDWVAARLVGRWRDGGPLVPRAMNALGAAENSNDFLYHFEDRFGLACPIGAHIRRANPRDSLGPDPQTALRISKMHRIIRRGRSYGERLSYDTNVRSRDAPHSPRGMLFICLNADIETQFELIQHSWLNNVHFGGLYEETDPIGHFRSGKCIMTIQLRPANLRIGPFPKFITVRGGAYFFLPGIEALQSLGS